MNPDKFDIKIQEAAAQNEPAYNEAAWCAMEKLLDKEMPQKKKDRRKIFWWFLLLFLVGGGSSLLIWKGVIEKDSTIPVISGSTNISTGTKEKITSKQDGSPVKNITKKLNSEEELNQHKIETSPFSNPANNDGMQTQDNIVINGISVRATVEIINKKDDKNYDTAEIDSKKSRTVQLSKGAQGVQTIPNTYKILADRINNEGRIQKANPSPNRVLTQFIPENNNEDDNNTIIKIDKKNDHRNISTKETAATRSGNTFPGSLALQFSIGPDVSAVNLKNIGKMNLIYGAGLSYAINKTFSIKTGFYVSRKIYDAHPDEYNPPPGFWNYYPNLKYIDADCKIFEVPLIINFHFKPMRDHQWFASAGLSSYFMKSENYNYFSKSSSGQTWYNNYFIKNKNHHLFASLRLGAGYERKLNNRISITAVPYVNLPLKGIGYGKVRLYNAGVLLSLSVKPFYRK